jgi:hypothetical protein
MPNRKHKSADTIRMLASLPGGVGDKALAKVGTSDVSKLSWLLDLLNRPVGSFATIPSSELKELESEVAVFCEPLGSIEGGPRGRLTVGIIGDLHHHVSGVVEALLVGASAELQIPSVALYLIPGSGCRYIGTPNVMFRLATARLLENEGHRIKRCTRPGCGRLFAHRKRGLYCGRKCSQLVQFRRYVERHAGS